VREKIFKENQDQEDQINEGWSQVTVGTFHTKGRSKIFLVIFSTVLVKIVFLID
jgi:hypothetical protein